MRKEGKMQQTQKAASSVSCYSFLTTSQKVLGEGEAAAHFVFAQVKVSIAKNK